MGYGKAWKVPVEKLEDLITNVDAEGNCTIEVWHDTSDKIADCQLWLLLPLPPGWVDLIPTKPPVNPNA